MRKFILELAGPLDRQTRLRPPDRRGQHRSSANNGGDHAGLLLQRYFCENATGDAGGAVPPPTTSEPSPTARTAISTPSTTSLNIGRPCGGRSRRS